MGLQWWVRGCFDSLFFAGQLRSKIARWSRSYNFETICRNSSVQKQHRVIDVNAVWLLAKPVLERYIYIYICNHHLAPEWLVFPSNYVQAHFQEIPPISTTRFWSAKKYWENSVELSEYLDLGSLLFAAYFSASHADPGGKPLRECKGRRCVQKKSI